jgi:Domain of unknown function (DUF4124)
MLMYQYGKSAVTTIAALLAAVLVTSGAHAQAYRCEANGKVTYGETPCANAQPIATTQDSAAQKKQADKAEAKLQKDDANVNKRIDTRADRESKERIAAMKAAPKSAAAPTVKKAKKKSASKSRGGVKTMKAVKKSSAKKKRDNSAVSAPTKA